MQLFSLVWVTSCLSCLFASTLTVLKFPDYLSSTLPTKVFSAVGNPLESFNPFTAQPQLYATAKGSQEFSATLPSFAFNPNAVISEPSSNSAKPASRTPSWISAVENALCHPTSRQTTNSRMAASTPLSSSPLKVEASTSGMPKSSLTNKIVQAIQNLFHWSDKVEPKINPRSFPVKVVRVSTNTRINRKSQVQPNAQLSSQPRKTSAEAKPQKNQNWYQVWVKEDLIAEIPNKHQAELMAQKLKQILYDPQLNASELHPGIVDGKPAIQMGTRMMFVIDDALSANLNITGELLAIEWANNLRVALGEAALKTVEAQTKMYALVETPAKIEGLASWYGDYFHGRMTANGETYDQYEFTAAHPSLPFNTFLKVKNKASGDAVIVRVNDRGPYVAPRKLDLSRLAARCIQSEEAGVVEVEAVIMQQRMAQSQASGEKSMKL